MRTLRIAMVVVFSLAAHGQTSRGAVTGTVLDQSGAVVRGAHVCLTGVDTGAKFAAASNDSGLFRFDAVDLGVYTLELGYTILQIQKDGSIWPVGSMQAE